jgi:hypothetical protein
MVELEMRRVVGRKGSEFSFLMEDIKYSVGLLFISTAALFSCWTPNQGGNV